jgi:hypothetical protein
VRLINTKLFPHHDGQEEGIKGKIKKGPRILGLRRRIKEGNWNDISVCLYIEKRDKTEGRISVWEQAKTLQTEI